MKNFLVILVLGLISDSAFAQFRPGPRPHRPIPQRPGPQYPGPRPGQNNVLLIQNAERLQIEASRLETAVVFGRLNLYTVGTARQLSLHAGSLVNCLRVSNNCAQEIQLTNLTLLNLQRGLTGLPFNHPVNMQIQRVQLAMDQVVNSQVIPGPRPGPGPRPNLVVSGEIDRLPFSLQAQNERTIESLCLEFGRARRILRVNMVVANGRRFDLRGDSLEQACRLVADQAR